ncbi:MAG: hypothetical protein NC084_12150 [Bacteroides sp.]|nr:hypothetical protein [Eubacterium sp.]MCM1419515.1 hypothetical protein [Roseburia sp.]MCM1463445.1 hypothetical protein [Bacteroides sp.]
MFTEMDKQVLNFRFGKAEMWFRFDIRAFYNIEKSGYSPFDILSQSDDPKAVRCFLRNGLSDWYEDTADQNSLDSYLNGLMSAESYQKELVALLQAAIMLALPRAVKGKRKKNEGGGAGNILGLMSAFVDVMGASRSEFMQSTLREATERWERYAVAMGYQKPAEKFKRFDDDDDDE